MNFVFGHQKAAPFNISIENDSEFECDFIFAGHVDHLQRLGLIEDDAIWNESSDGE